MGEQKQSSGKPAGRPADRQGRAAAGDIPRPDAHGQRPWSEQAMEEGQAPYESQQPAPPPGAEDAGHGYTQDSGFPQSKGYHGSEGVAEPYASEGGFGSAEGDVGPLAERRTSQEATPTDARLQDEVRAELEREELVSTDLAVRVQGGAVTLEGHVANAQERARAQQLAEAVRGVQSVENRLRADAP